jgi:glutathione S-transferase
VATIDFYYAPGACSLVSHIALETVGAVFLPHPLALMAGEHKAPDYLALNPSGNVPTLVVDGKPLVETLAIIFWLDTSYPEAGLLPRHPEPFAAACDLAVIDWFAATAHPVFTRFRVPPSVIDDPSAFEKVARHAAPALAGHFETAARRLGRNDWLLGDWSIADAYLFWLWTEATAGGFPVAGFPSLVAHAERVVQRPATLRALAREAQALAEFERRGVAMKFSNPR